MDTIIITTTATMIIISLLKNIGIVDMLSPRD